MGVPRPLYFLSCSGESRSSQQLWPHLDCLSCLTPKIFGSSLEYGSRWWPSLSHKYWIGYCYRIAHFGCCQCSAGYCYIDSVFIDSSDRDRFDRFLSFSEVVKWVYWRDLGCLPFRLWGRGRPGFRNCVWRRGFRNSRQSCFEWNWLVDYSRIHLGYHR